MTITFPPRMTREQAAEYVGLSVASLSADVVTNRLKIPYLKIGRRCIYVREHLDKWMNSHAVNSVVESVNA